MRNVVKFMDLEESHHRMFHDLFSWDLAYYGLWSFYVVRLEKVAVDRIFGLYFLRRALSDLSNMKFYSFLAEKIF